MNKFLALLGFDPAKHSVRVEIMAGLTTFLTMSYILAVNPQILGEAGMDKGALFSATIVSAVRNVGEPRRQERRHRTTSCRRRFTRKRRGASSRTSRRN